MLECGGRLRLSETFVACSEGGHWMISSWVRPGGFPPTPWTSFTCGEGVRNEEELGPASRREPTTHGFCQESLGRTGDDLGLESWLSSGAR